MRAAVSAFVLCGLIGLSFTPAMADTLVFPKTGEPMFQITIPDSWQADSDDDDVVEAVSPKENVALSIWEIESKTTVGTVADDLQDILKEYATDVKLDQEPKQMEIGGLPGIFIVGGGKDEDDGHEVGFIAMVLVHEDDAAIVFFELDENITPSELKKFEKIIESISVPTK